MYAAAFIGDKIIDLAGWDQGPGAETSNLRISYDSQFQQVSYIGGTYSRQFWRPGTMVTVNFDSRFDFPDLYTSEYQAFVSYYLFHVPEYFSNQSGCVFRLTAPRPGYPGVRQVERAIAVGTAVGNGNVKFTITASGMDDSPYSLNVGVANGDTASEWMNKAVIEISRREQVISMFSVTGSGTSLYLTRRSPYATTNDTTLNIAYTQTEGTGIVADSTSSTSTDAGAWSVMRELVIYDANVSVATSQIGRSVLLNTSVTGRLA